MSSQAEAQPLPAVFGRYVLLHRLSQGGMGEIFLAKLGEIQGFEKPIVIKKILQHLAQDQEFLDRFIEEAQIAIKLTHGNIVPVYEVGMVDNEYFLALQYIEGRDLRRMGIRCQEKKQQLPPDLCLYLVREITNGLAYAHRLADEEGRAIDLVHCDISPPNILVSYEGEVKIIDFGIAKSAIQRAQEDDAVGFGKLGYIAPEQLLRGSTVDRRADIYATGVLLYELLTGQRLFSITPGMDFRRIVAEVTAGRITRPSQRAPRLPDNLDNLVMRALKTAPDERYQSAEEFRDAIQRQLYAMNPAISADQLASFIQGLFAEELITDRIMLKSISQTDMELFRREIHDATHHTVSYALADLISQSRGSGDQPISTFQVAVAPGCADPDLGDPASEGSPGPGTRRMAGSERIQAAERSQERAIAELIPRRRRGAIVTSLVAIIVLLVGGITTGLLISRGPQRREGVQHANDYRPPLKAAKSASPDSAITRSDLAIASAAVAADDTIHHTFPPQTLSRTPSRNSAKMTRKPKKLYRKTSQKPRKIIPEKGTTEEATIQVQRKFRQVHREYQTFTQAFGKRLEREWQEIMFTNTYGKDDKYIRLNKMLNDLLARMNAIRKTGG